MGNEFAKGCNERAFGLRVFWSPEKLGCFLRSTSRTNFISFLERLVFLDLSFYYLSLYWNCKRCILLKNYEPQHSWFKDRLWLERVWLLQLRDGNFIPVLPFQHGLCTKKPSWFCVLWENFAKAKYMSVMIIISKQRKWNIWQLCTMAFENKIKPSNSPGFRCIISVKKNSALLFHPSFIKKKLKYIYTQVNIFKNLCLAKSVF